MEENFLILKKHLETILYLFFGALTVLINIITYLFFTRIINFTFLLSNSLSWSIAVLFSYITNKFFVFKSEKTEFLFLLKEFVSFLSCRLFSGFIEILLMYLMIDLFSLNDILVKIGTNIIVIILNFVFSKVVVFKHRN
ncbi:GtrA family protein [Clostridioides difficile]|uniref:GtrA family protein n=2 Tax=Clostridioides difficile TaxID=1496 RepID=UPI001CE11F9B|nr:GtrA family protein [Clostridioides difficile]MCA0787820.1 GtrA family protein [Clostridioides difficile]MCA0879160.1 GtrA family protein [Clostridioides difficile]MCB4307331.1 GtrA family protein [Clostridioides difficile]MCB4310419.1 GtrA family protein [Clostridioides difficile]MCC8876945.1 GtrA family protein [Clostridioides difficile]